MNEKNHLIEGPISPEFIAAKIEKHHGRNQIGAHSMFLGQVRADKSDGRQTIGIEYSAYNDMVSKTIKEIKEDLFSRYNDLICLHVWHSTGMVEVGEVSLLVLISSGHRKQSFKALEDIVEQIKSKLPVWKKEIFDDGSHLWQGF